MKLNLRLFLIVFTQFICLVGFGQTRSVQRIDLNQRANLYLKNVAQALLEANCKGFINAYYPLQPKIKVEFSSLANRFQIELNSVQLSGYFIENCCNGELCNLSNADLDKFKYYLEVVEDVYKTSNGIRREVVYLRLISKDIYGNEKGPLFYFDEIEKARVNMVNTENKQLVSLALVFGNHLYTDYTFSNENSVLDSVEIFNKNKENQKIDSDLWSN